MPNLLQLASHHLDTILNYHATLFPSRDRLALENGAMRAIITTWAAEHPDKRNYDNPRPNPTTRKSWMERVQGLAQKADACFYKAFPEHEQCRCNEGKNKQVEVYLYEWDHCLKPDASCMIEVHGDMRDNDWIVLTRHGIIGPDVQTIEAISESLLRTWDFAVQQHNQTP